MLNLGQIQQFLELCDLEIWRMTLKNNRAPLGNNIKLCASFHHDIWIQTSYGPETAKLAVDLCDLDLSPLILTFCMDVTFVIGNNSWKFHDVRLYDDGNIVKKVWRTVVLGIGLKNKIDSRFTLSINQLDRIGWSKHVERLSYFTLFTI